MSVDQYQRMVNSLDKEIADLESKKATVDKKAADEATKAAKITISKNASESTVKSKMREIESHQNQSRKASAASADYAKKIADKRTRRNDAYLKLQKAQRNEQQEQDRQIKIMREQYESRIAERTKLSAPKLVIDSKQGTFVIPPPEYDVFVSHAWEDKESFVDDFVAALRSLGVRVWYDTTQMKWGDSMRKKIDEGLRHSTFGVAVLSPNYIAEDKYWTKAELDGLFSLESVNGKLLLPIWHNLTKQQVLDFSPLIASKKAMKTADMTANEIAAALKDLL